MEIINITGEIGWDVTPDSVKSQLEKSKGKDIDVHVASPGGFVFDGIEIYNAFRDYKRKYPDAQMMLTIKGLAASMASYLAVNPAFDMVIAEDNAVFMIHNVWGGTVGDYRDMEKSAEVFKGLTDLLGKAYADKTGKSKKEVSDLMDSESWYFGEDIKTAGFVDEIIKAPEQIEKNSAVAHSKLKFSAMSEKLNSKKIDLFQAAAILKPEPITSTNPAMRDNITEVSSMNLNDFLKENPAAQTELRVLLDAENKAGYEKHKAESDERMAKASAIIKAEKSYPKQIKAVALDVMMGVKSLETLDTLVATADMFIEMKKSADAQSEQPADTKPEDQRQASDSSEIKTEEDYNAELIRMKKSRGMEV